MGEGRDDKLGQVSGGGRHALQGLWRVGLCRHAGSLSALYENLAGGATVDEFVEWFPGVDAQQVRTVLEHEARALRTAPTR